jgi:secondary thiamine-phosphate synthase enzyme
MKHSAMRCISRPASFINDDEGGLQQDFETWLEGLAPEKPYERNRHNGYEDNADAHLKRSVMDREVVVAVTEGKLDFGPWEQIFYEEFNGGRRKRVWSRLSGKKLNLCTNSKIFRIF